MLQTIHIIVTLIAALTVAILSLYQNVTFYQMCIRLVIIIPSFFILGCLFQFYLNRLFAPPKEENEENEENEGDLADELSETPSEDDSTESNENDLTDE